MGVFIDGNGLGVGMRVIVATSVGLNALCLTGRRGGYLTLVPIVGVFIDGNGLGVGMRVIVATSVGLNAHCLTGGRGGYLTLVPIVTQSVNDDSNAACIFAAFRTLDNLIVRAGIFAGSVDHVLYCFCISGGVTVRFFAFYNIAMTATVFTSIGEISVGRTGGRGYFGFI